MKNQHTKGPWQTAGAFNEFVTTGKDHVCAERITHSDEFELGEHEANMRLIAAAPELLEACEAVASHFKATGLSNEEHDLNEMIIRALKKAKGKE